MPRFNVAYILIIKMNIINIIKTGINNIYTAWAQPKFFIYMLIFGLCICGIYFLLKYLSDYDIIKKQISKFQNDVEKQIALKQKAMIRSIEDSNEENRTKYFIKVDKLISNSGLKQKIPGFTAGLFIIFMVVSVIIELILFMMLLDSMFYAIIYVALIQFGIITTLTLIGEYNIKKLEDELKTFVDLLKNYSTQTDDVVTLIDKISCKINEPLKHALEEFVYECRTGTNISISFDHLKNKVDHPQFAKIINNLKLAYQNEANYARVIDLNNKVLKLYLSAKEKDRAIKSSNRTELLLIFVFGNVIMHLLPALGAAIEFGSDAISQGLTICSNAVLVFSLLFTLKN